MKVQTIDTEEVTFDSIVYEYEEIEHDREGMMVPCRACDAQVFLKHVAAFGCHECDMEARGVTIRAKE